MCRLSHCAVTVIDTSSSFQPHDLYRTPFTSTDVTYSLHKLLHTSFHALFLIFTFHSLFVIHFQFVRIPGGDFIGRSRVRDVLTHGDLQRERT
jgi:hypothetical protein